METFASPPGASASSSGMFSGQPSDGMSAGSLSMTLGMPTPSGSDLPPLPSISPPSSAFASSSFQVGQQPSPTWSPQEMQMLLAGLTEFPADQFDPVTRYIKIAAMIPAKCVRDVALQAKAVAACGSNSAEATQWLSSQFPSPARAAKRMKIEPFGGQNQPDVFSMMPPTPTMAVAAGDRRGASGELDDDVARQLDALLQDNVVAISTMRANLLGGTPDDNTPQMLRFHDNYQAVMSALGGACVSVPPLPVRPDASLLPTTRETSGDQHGSK